MKLLKYVYEKINKKPAPYCYDYSLIVVVSKPIQFYRWSLCFCKQRYIGRNNNSWYNLQDNYQRAHLRK